MLQHNNNNNYPCLDMAHRELLHGCRRNGTTFSSALGFGAIPLIKGLRAWAVSGGYSRSKRKAAAACHTSDPALEGRVGTRNSKIHSFHAPGIRQGELGALVTVATLKDSDGGRQTQTRCLFLKAEGCNYLCAVGTKVDGRISGKGNQVGFGVCDGKPVRKWRKSNKRPKSMENISVVEYKEDVDYTKAELFDKCSLTQCLKAESALTAMNKDEDLVNRSEFSTLRDTCESAASSPSTEYNCSTEVKGVTTPAPCSELNDCEDIVGTNTSASTTDCTEISKHENDLTDFKSKEADLPNSEERSPESGVVTHDKNVIVSTISHNHCSSTDTIKCEIDILSDRDSNKSNEFGVDKSQPCGLESEVPSQDTNKTNGTLLPISHSHCQEAVCVDADSFNHDMERIVPFGEEQNDSIQEVDHVSEPAGETWGSPASPSRHKRQKLTDVNMTYKDGKQLTTTNLEDLCNSSSQGSFKVANAITSLPNPALTTNRAALRSISRQQQEETQGMRLALKQALELLGKQERGQEADKVADEGPEVLDEEDGDEFGVFMKAGDEQIWTEGFNELQKVPCEKHADVGIRKPSNRPSSPWISDWTRDLSLKKSEDTWTAFKQEVDNRGTEECWFSTAVENTHLTHSSLITVPNVFLEAFPSLQSSWGESGCTPTLTELLQGSATEISQEVNGRQSLLDGLQDLDRMFGVKYKVAESLSRKRLLLSLKLRTLNPVWLLLGWNENLLPHRPFLDRFGHPAERPGGRKQNTARSSPNLPTSNQQLAANAKRRLSYDINRNVMS